MWNDIGKLKMIKTLSGTDLTQTVQINELFSQAALASQVLSFMLGNIPSAPVNSVYAS